MKWTFSLAVAQLLCEDLLLFSTALHTQTHTFAVARVLCSLPEGIKLKSSLSVLIHAVTYLLLSFLSFHDQHCYETVSSVDLYVLSIYNFD